MKTNLKNIQYNIPSLDCMQVRTAKAHICVSVRKIEKHSAFTAYLNNLYTVLDVSIPSILILNGESVYC